MIDFPNIEYKIYKGNIIDIIKNIPLVHCVVTSPPYFNKRKYGDDVAEIGKEKDINIYIKNLVEIFNSIPLHKNGSLWVNIGDTRKEHLLMIPEKFAIKMIENGWKLIDNVIWAKIENNDDGSTDGHCMIEPATGRLNGNGYENIYRFIKCPLEDAWSDTCSVRIPRQNVDDKRYLPKSLMQTHTSIEGRCLSNVWRINMGQSHLKHYAVFPKSLCERPIAMTCPIKVCRECGYMSSRIVEMQQYDEKRNSKRIFGKYNSIEKEQLTQVSGRMDSGRNYIPKKPVTIGWTECNCKNWQPGIVFDPFMGSGSTAEASLLLGRSIIGVDIYQDNVNMSNNRCKEILDFMKINNLNPWKEMQ